MPAGPVWGWSATEPLTRERERQFFGAIVPVVAKVRILVAAEFYTFLLGKVSFPVSPTLRYTVGDLKND